MSAHVTDEDTKKVAGLIRVHLPQNELPLYTKQLNTVLEAADVLKELDTDSVTETSQTHGLVNVLAEDVPEPGLDINVYPNKKNVQNNYFVVEKVL